MFKRILVLVMLTVPLTADHVQGEARGTMRVWDSIEVTREQSHPDPGMGANALFIFAAYDWEWEYALAQYYWHPTEDPNPSGWDFDVIHPSSIEPEGNPYHWNGGFGSAYTNLGYTWEWYPTYNSRIGLQTIPDVTILDDYDVIYFHAFDYWWDNGAISPEVMDVLSEYMDSGGLVILIGQDIHFSGTSPIWLDNYFTCGTIINDVYSGDPTLPASGTTGSFAEGWDGVADQTHYSEVNGFYPDALAENGFLGDGTFYFASVNPASKCMFSTFEFETCAAAEVGALASLIIDYIMGGGALEQLTWAGIKSSF